MARELFSAVLRVKPTDLARGSAFFKLTAEGQCHAGAPQVGSAEPQVLQNLLLLPLSYRCSDHMSSQRVEQSPGGSYSYQGIQCDANPAPDEAVAGTIIYFIILPVRNVTKT